MKAINISLLLPQGVNEEVSQLQHILKNSDTSTFPGYPFFKMPHITLCHLYVTDEEIAEIKKHIEEIVSKIGSLYIVNIGVEQGNLNHIANEKSTPLMMLHRSCINIIRSYLGRKGKEGYFFGTDICNTTIQRVNGYSPESRSPHITLGPGVIEYTGKSKKYQATGIALGHLGRYCTIGEVLEVFDL